MSDEQHKPWCSEQARELNGGCICKPSELAAPAGSATLKSRIARIRERRKWSSGHYSVHIDELYELLSILEIIIEAQERQTEKLSNTEARHGGPATTKP